MGQNAVEPAKADGSAQVAQRSYLPLAIDVSGLKCLVVGGGRVGARKALALTEGGADVAVLAPTVSERLRSAVASGRVCWRRGRYSRDALAGSAFVVAATSDAALNVRIGEDAEAMGLLCCVASPGRVSRVLFPAVHAHGQVTVAVHSNGADCAESRKVRDEIAGMLARRGEQPARLAVYGAQRRDLPAHVSEALAGESAEALREAGVLVLSTCRRWECWFEAPSVSARVRDIRRIVHERSGLLLESHASSFYTKADGRAFLHLLRVAAGLDSPLVGETNVVAQVRAAAAQSEPAGSGLLGGAFEAALLAQKRLRKESGLAADERDWAAAVVSLLGARLEGLRARRVLVFGCGRLGEAVTRRLLSEGAAVVPLSRRALTNGVPWCAAMGLAALPDWELPRFLDQAHAVVLASDLSEKAERLLQARVRAGGCLVVDLTGRHEGLRCASGGWFGLDEVGKAPLSGPEAARTAAAEELAFEHAVRWLVARRGCAPTPPALTIGARASRLSRSQAADVVGFLRLLAPGLEADVVAFETPGDRDKETPLPRVSDDDFFTRDLDEALLAGRIDLAVHSAKDLPRRLRQGLCVAAVTPAFAPWEALVSRDGQTLAELGDGARVGTSSERRRARLAAIRPDVRTCDVRGNVPDRIAQLDAGAYDALVLAAAGLIRLGLEARMSQVFPLDEFAPEPGQGRLALVVREDDARLRSLVEPLDLGERRDMPWA